MTVSQPPVPSPPMEVSTDSIESEKVRRPCRFGQNLPLQARVFSPKTFSLSRLYNGGRRQRKQATDGKVDTIKKEQHTDNRILLLYAILTFY